MKTLTAKLLLLLFIAATARAEVTPMDAPLPPGQTTTIEVEYTEGPIESRAGAAVDVPRGPYHYRVYVPSTYDDDKETRFPCLFVASPGGEAGMPAAKERLMRDQYIVIMLVESKNGPWGPIVGNFMSAHDDAVKRLRILEGFKFHTGFSGGARASSSNVRRRPGFTGLILQGAGYGDPQYTSAKENPHLGVFLLMGQTDDVNRQEVAQLRNGLPQHTPFNYEIFDGGHGWAPESSLNNALDWLENHVHFNLPNTAGTKPLFQACFQRQMKLSATDGLTPFEKYEYLERALNLANQRKLAAIKELAEPIAQLKKQVPELAKDPEVAKEIAARDAYRKIYAAESKMRTQRVTEQVMKQNIPAVIDAYSKFIEKHPGTAYAKRAEAKLVGLKAEAS